jgi:hypothetical protein
LLERRAQFGHIIPSHHPASNDTRGDGKAGKKRSFMQDLATDDSVKSYAKSKYVALQGKAASGGKKDFKRKSEARGSAYKGKGVKRK